VRCRTEEILKGTLHYTKKNAEADKPFSLNAHVKERLEMRGGIESSSNC